MQRYWLMKCEPAAYTIDDLARRRVQEVRHARRVVGPTLKTGAALGRRMSRTVS
jgi:hypothetical protein